MSKYNINKQEQQVKRQRLSLSTWKKCSPSPFIEVNNSSEERKQDVKTEVETKKLRFLDMMKKTAFDSELFKSSYDPGDRIYAGFSNMGNTCFLSSILHVLRFTPNFLCQLHQLCQMIKKVKTTKETIPSNWKLILELHQVFVTVREIEASAEEQEEQNKEETNNSNRQKEFFPRDLLFYLQNLNPIFKGTLQHDAHELLCWFLNTIQEVTLDIWNRSAKEEMNCGVKKWFIKEDGQKMKKSKKNGDNHCFNFISDTFKGNLIIETRCAECENITTIKETFLNIGLSPEQVLIEGVKMPEVISKAILKCHILQGDNKYWCDNCIHYNEALRTVRFKHMPPILIIHVERFSNDVSFGTSKISAFIPTPFELECFLDHNNHPCEIAEHRYFLYAVVSHSGISLSSGHYTASIKVSRSDVPCNISNEVRNLENTKWNNSGNFCQNFQNLCSCNEQGIQSRNCDKIKNSFIKPLTCVCPHMDCCNPFLCETQIQKLFTDSEHVWIDCDDDKCNILSNKEIISRFSSSINGSNCTPYLLFYTRKSFQ